VALPNFEHFPAIGAQQPAVALIAIGIAAPFLRPERFVRRGRWFAVFATVHVPEAAVDEKHRFSAREHQIRLAWQIFHVQTVAKSHTMEQFPHAHLGLRVPALDAGHVEAARLGSVNVGHACLICSNLQCNLLLYARFA